MERGHLLSSSPFDFFLSLFPALFHSLNPIIKTRIPKFPETFLQSKVIIFTLETERRRKDEFRDIGLVFNDVVLYLPKAGPELTMNV